MTPHPLRQLTRHLVGLVAVGLLCSLVGITPAYAASVDDYSEYEPQTTCSTTTKPGTAFLLRWLVRHYPHTGYSSTLRSCSGDGSSEHKDGRALDWSVDVDDATQRAQAEKFLDLIFATDSAGNRHSLARRMGIMYLIWNDHIWSSYGSFEKRDYLSSGCQNVKKCSKTLRHRDHVHISLSRSGAGAQTTFYRSRNVPSEPVLKPGTMQLDSEDTAIVKVTVPATGVAVNVGFKLTRGTTYRIVGDGLYRAGPGAAVADAACRWSANGWAPSDWTASETGLLVNGKNPWTSSCDGTHTHVAEYTATTTDYLRVRVGGEQTSSGEGSLSFYILREDLATRSVASHPVASGAEPRPAGSAGPAARRLRNETVAVRAAARRGTLTDRSLRQNHRYRVLVTGLATSGPDVFDGNCVKYAGRFRPQHTLDLTKPSADHLSLFISGVRVNLRVPGSKASCDRRDHRYVGSYRAVVRGRARVRVWDPYTYVDNTGQLTVTLAPR